MASQSNHRISNLKNNIALDELSLTVKKSNLTCLQERGRLDSLKESVKEAEGALEIVTAKKILLEAEIELKTAFIASKNASVARIALKQSAPSTWPKFSPPGTSKLTAAIKRASTLKEKKLLKLERLQKRLERLKNPKKKRKRVSATSKKAKKAKIDVTG